jgi:four helix bundle protein
MKKLPWKGYAGWEEQVQASIKNDRLWSFETYRKALFFADLAWFDAEKLFTDPRGKAMAWQLVDAAGSVSANIEEGFGRGFGKDYARFLRISLGSCRETRGWYYRARHVFDPQILIHRLQLADEIISGLVTAANQQRDR